jgi:hypothetical protein
VVGADSVLFALVPPSLVHSSISPPVDTETFLLVEEVLAVVSYSVSVHVDAVARHIVVQPLAVALTTILPKVDA